MTGNRGDLPERLVFVDVETTGLHSADRVVSLAAVELVTASIPSGSFDVRCRHLVFDPGKKSHPRAEAVHGYDDWTLRHQDLFEDHVEALAPLFSNPGAIWAHNAPFDQRFIASEFHRAGRPLAPAPFQCTMALYRQHRNGRAGLNAILQEMGLARSTHLHSALEDAWMAMLVWLHLSGMRVTAMPPASLLRPSNLVEAPPLIGKLPRRKRRKPIGSISHDPAVENEPPERFIPPELAEQIKRTAWPLAVAMLSIARSDDNIQEAEFSAIAALVTEIAHREGVQVAGATEYFDLTADLIEGVKLGDDTLNRASELIWADTYCRENLARWVREVSYADGGSDDAEHKAISALTERLRSAKNR